MELIGDQTVKYTFRTKSILKRLQSEKSRLAEENKKLESRDKDKPAPLSKYRRKTANARERNRMKELNDAYVTLQGSLPCIPGSDSDKLTKSTVLKLAVNYISALKVALLDKTPPMKVEEVRNMWRSDNAHMTKTENSVSKTTIRNATNKFEETQLNSPCKAFSNIFPVSQFNKDNKVGHSLMANKKDSFRDKYLHSIKQITPKKPSKSRTRGKVCRTNSVATNNGAYITLKNCAMQTTPSARNNLINNQPLMMSMTVKRTRMEPIVGHRSIKMKKYEPSLAYSTAELNNYSNNLAVNHIINAACVNWSTGKSTSNPMIVNHEIPKKVTKSNQNFNSVLQNNIANNYKTINFGNVSFNVKENGKTNNDSIISKPTCSKVIDESRNNGTNSSNFSQRLQNQIPSFIEQFKTQQCTTRLPFQDLDSPPIRNDVLLPRNAKLSTSSESTLSSGESAPSSPTLSLQSSSPPTDDSYPFSSLSDLAVYSSSYNCISASDCDSVFGSLLESDPFQDDFDSLASSMECDNKLFNSFIDQTSPQYLGFNHIA